MIGALMVKKKTRSAFKSLNEGDVESFIKDWAEDVVFEYPTCLKVGGKIQGKQNIKKWFEDWLEQFPKRRFDLKNVCVKNLCAFGGTNVAVVEWLIDFTNKDGHNVKTSGVTVIEARKGKAVRICDYISDTELLKEAWGEK